MDGGLFFFSSTGHSTQKPAFKELSVVKTARAQRSQAPRLQRSSSFEALCAFGSTVRSRVRQRQKQELLQVWSCFVLINSKEVTV